MILTHINIHPELLIKEVAIKLRMWVEAHPYDTCQPLRKSSASLGTVWVGNENGDLWHGMVSL